MDSDEAIGEAIRGLRQELGMSHAALAQEMTDAGLPGIYPQTVVKIEQGKRMLRYREGVVIADIFGLEGHALLMSDDAAGDDRELMRLLRSMHDASIRTMEGAEDLRTRYLALTAFAAEAGQLTDHARLTARANARSYGPEATARRVSALLDEVPELDLPPADGGE